MRDRSPPEIVSKIQIPRDIFNKRVNEAFIQKIMSLVFKDTVWRAGNPQKFEPDYFCDDIPFEFTLASNKQKKKNYIQQIRFDQYSTEDAEEQMIAMIYAAINSKLQKNYSVENIHLCILCLMDMTFWVLGEYGSLTCSQTDHKRQELFDKIKKKYINSGSFANIFIIFPDIAEKWWVWDVLSGEKKSVLMISEQSFITIIRFLIVKHETLYL